MNEYTFDLEYTTDGHVYQRTVQAKNYADAIDLISFDIRQGAVIQKFTESRIRYKYVIHINDIYAETDWAIEWKKEHIILSPKELTKKEIELKIEELDLEVETDSRHPYEGYHEVLDFYYQEVLYEA